MASTPIYNWPTPDNTDLVKNGALAIRTLGDAIDTTVDTMIPETIFAAKGDLLGASANDTPAVLTVGANGETLVADSSTSTGLRWQGDYAAGKNKFINGDFSVNQRGFTSTTGNDVYTFDRWRTSLASLGTGVATYSAQTFTPGTAPVAGYEGTNFFRIVTTGFVAGGTTSSGVHFDQRIEDVRTFANQTVSVSFWAKANSGTPNVAVRLQQSFGSGGSTAVFALFGSVTAISTSWVRYTFTGTVPSISGKTIGAGSYVTFRLYAVAGSAVADVGGVGLQDNTFDFWGIQAENGSVATAFQTATGTIQGELAAAQRYYYRQTASQVYSTFGQGSADATTSNRAIVTFPVTMRIVPTSIDYSNLANFDGVTVVAVTTAALGATTQSTSRIDVTASVASGLTQFRPYTLLANNSTSAYIGFSSEL
jgi:hypothetical protein